MRGQTGKLGASSWSWNAVVLADQQDNRIIPESQSELRSGLKSLSSCLVMTFREPSLAKAKAKVQEGCLSDFGV